MREYARAHVRVVRAGRARLRRTVRGCDAAPIIAKLIITFARPREPDRASLTQRCI
jgi:hypothetical protein